MRVYNDPRVDKEIRALPRKDSARIVQVSELFADHGFSLTALYLKKLTVNVWELRSGDGVCYLEWLVKRQWSFRFYLRKHKRHQAKLYELQKKD